MQLVGRGTGNRRVLGWILLPLRNLFRKTTLTTRALNQTPRKSLLPKVVGLEKHLSRFQQKPTRIIVLLLKKTAVNKTTAITPSKMENLALKNRNPTRKWLMNFRFPYIRNISTKRRDLLAVQPFCLDKGRFLRCRRRDRSNLSR